MFLTLAGSLLAVLGLLSGLMLVGSPPGLGPAAPGFVIWLPLPLFTAIGSLLPVMGSKSAAGGFGTAALSRRADPEA
jgi:hypothetical protein